MKTKENNVKAWEEAVQFSVWVNSVFPNRMCDHHATFTIDDLEKAYKAGQRSICDVSVSD